MAAEMANCSYLKKRESAIGIFGEEILNVMERSRLLAWVNFDIRSFFPFSFSFVLGLCFFFFLALLLSLGFDEYWSVALVGPRFGN